jgi:GAF domain-containing protein
LRILHLEDNLNDAELIQAAVEGEGIRARVTRVETQGEFVASLDQGGFDIILADYTLPSFDGVSALRIALGKCPDVPFIFVSGTLGEEVAIEALKIGATDYLLKDRPSKIAPAVHRAVREAKERGERKRAEALLAGEKRLLEMIATGATLSAILDALCRLVEELSPACLSSILLLDPDGHRLWHGAAPSLPRMYLDAIDGSVIGPAAGSCGTAAYRKVPVIVSDIARDPLWADYRDLALPHGLRACWSTPILASDGRVLGTFAIYAREPGRPTPQQESIIQQLTELSSIAIERKGAEEERQAHLWLLESMDRVNRAIQGTNDLEQMMSDVLDAVLSIFGCDRSWLVHPCDPDAASWSVSMEHTRPEFPGAFVQGLDLPVDADIARAFRAVGASSTPVRFGPGADHPLPAQAAEHFSIQSMIAMAIHPKGDRPYMFGLHQCSYPRAWLPREERLFQEIGRRLEDALTSLLMFRNLHESERRLEDAQRISHVGYWERDLATNRYTWSDEIYRIFGLPPQQRIVSFSEVQEMLHPGDREMRAAAVAAGLQGGRGTTSSTAWSGPAARCASSGA